MKLRLANRPAGQVLRAIAGAGPKNAHTVASQLLHRLSKAELAALAGTSTRHMSAWLAKELRELKVNG